jgi:large subunit ribosomal protein L15
MNLSDIRKAKIPRRYKFPAGRGHSSGLGKQCGRGRKGQYVRQGTSFRHYFEGGQMPMLRRLPKFGFNNAEFRTEYEEVNLSDLEKHFAAGSTVDRAALEKAGLVRRCELGVKVLGGGKLTKRLSVKVEAFTKSAEAAITKAGGSAERIAGATPCGAEAPAQPAPKRK